MRLEVLEEWWVPPRLVNRESKVSELRELLFSEGQKIIPSFSERGDIDDGLGQTEK